MYIVLLLPPAPLFGKLYSDRNNSGFLGPYSVTTAGRTRTDNIGVGAGADIGGIGSTRGRHDKVIGTTTDMSVRCRRPPR